MTKYEVQFQPDPYEDEVKMLKADGFGESEIEEIIFYAERYDCTIAKAIYEFLKNN